VDVCLKLLDIPQSHTPKLQVTSLHRGLNASGTTHSPLDEPRSRDSGAKGGSKVAGAQSSKPRCSQQGSQLSAGASKMQPQPLQVKAMPVPIDELSLNPMSAGPITPGKSNAGKGEGPGVGNSTVTFFQIGLRAKTVVYVIDRSVSMGPNGKLARAKQELQRSVEQLSVDARFQIVLFNRSIEVLTVEQTAGLFSATPENKLRATEFLKSVLPEGGTRPVPALKWALAMKPDVIYFLSDSEDLNKRDVREVTNLNRGRSAIHALQIEDGQTANPPSSLQMLAQSNRGEFRVVFGTSGLARSPNGN